MYFETLDPKDWKEIMMFTVGIEKEFPAVEDPKNLYPKLSRKFLERFSESELLPGGFVYWETIGGKSKFYDDILKYWTIETIIHAVVSMVEDSLWRLAVTLPTPQKASTGRRSMNFCAWSGWMVQRPSGLR